jgi:hypothetical protein
MIKLEDINNDVIFDPIPHTYHKNGKEFTSVSVLIGNYKPIFDEAGHIKRACAKREGLTVPQIEEKWEKAKIDGCARGTSFHGQIEHFILNNEILDQDYKDVVEKFKKDFRPKFKGKLFCEIPLHHPEYGIAGTADLLELMDDNKTIYLYDWKTNKEINLKSKYKKKLLYPLDHLDECEINTYGIQLNLYKNMLEYHGYNVKKITLYHINPETRNIDSYKIANLQTEVKDLLEHFKKIQEF